MSLLLLLTLIEASLRISKIYQTRQEASGVGFFSIYETFGRTYNWTRPPNTTITVDYPEFRYAFTTNSLGLRDKERSILPSVSNRVLLLGDSFIESFGAPDDSSVTVIMNSILSQNYGVDSVEIISGAVAGSDVFFNYLLLESTLLNYKPNLVLININSTDIMDYCVRGGLNRVAPNGALIYRPCPINRVVYKYLHLYRFWVQDLIRRDKNTFLTYKELEKLKAEFAPAVNEVLKKVDDLSAKQQFRYKVIWQPLQSETAQGKYEESFEGINPKHTINLMDSFRFAKPIDKVYWPIDRHFTPYGNSLYARFLINRLTQENLLAN